MTIKILLYLFLLLLKILHQKTSHDVNGGGMLRDGIFRDVLLPLDVEIFIEESK